MCSLADDFLGKAGTTLVLPWVDKEVAAAGAPTTGYTTDSANGELTYTHDATDENQITGVSWDDAVHVDPTEGAVFEARVKLTADGGAMASTRRMCVGLAAAHNADPDLITESAWFRVGDAADLVLKVESDDGTTDTDDQDTGESVSDATFHTYRIELDDTSAIKFIFDGEEVATTDAGALASADRLQPYIMLEKDSGTTADSMVVDYCRVDWRRG